MSNVLDGWCASALTGKRAADDTLRVEPGGWISGMCEDCSIPGQPRRVRVKAGGAFVRHKSAPKGDMPRAQRQGRAIHLPKGARRG